MDRERERRKYSAGRIVIRLLLGGFVLIINIYVIFMSIGFILNMIS